jgi:hypothetical protein
MKDFNSNIDIVNIHSAKSFISPELVYSNEKNKYLNRIGYMNNKNN